MIEILKSKTKNAFEFVIAKPEHIFLTLALIFGLFSAIVVPQMSVADEDTHLNAIYTYASFEFHCDKTHELPSKIVDKISGSERGARNYYFDFASKVDEGDTLEIRCAGYGPFSYVPQIMGVWLSKVIYPSASLMILLARLLSFLAFLVAGFFMIKRLKVGKYVLLSVLLIPTTLHFAASLSSDATNNLIMFAGFVLVANLFVQENKISKRQILCVLGLVALSMLTKPSDLIFLLPLIFLPKRLFIRNKFQKIPFNLQKWGIAILSCTTLILSYFISNLLNANNSNVLGATSNNPTTPLSFLKILYNTYFGDFSSTILDETFNQFSSFGYHAPFFMLFFNIFIVIITLLYRNNKEKVFARKVTKSQAISFLSTAAVFIIIVSYILFTTWAKPGSTYADGVQGRYFIALIPLFVPLFILIQEFLKIDIKEKHFRILIFIFLLIVLLSYSYLTIHFVVHDFYRANVIT